ncbi:TetR/AcrR family transcriptional regulator [Rhizobium sp. PAMB 3182]
MKSQDKSHERVNQKRRTRAELLRAAQEMTEQGLQPSVAEVADHAGISRATAYRYFSTPEELIREAALDAVARNITVELPNAVDVRKAPEDRLADVVGQIYAMVEDNEPMFRALLASSATGKSATKRGGRRLTWLREALDPLKQELPAKDYERLIHGLSLMTGIETQVVLKDICELSPARAREVSIWAARMLLAGVLASARR